LNIIFNKYKKNTKDKYLYLIEKCSPYLTSNLHFIDNLEFENFFHNTEKLLQNDVSTEVLMHNLRIAKKQFSTLTAVKDLRNEWDDLTIMSKLSQFADLCINITLNHLITLAFKDGKLPSPEIENSGISIIALGKLGSKELNYSSDIDLLVLFNKEDYKDVYVEITKKLVNILNMLTKDGYVFRVDLRIRPEPENNDLAVSLKTAKKYYMNSEQDWERTAMIRARHVAGDALLSKDFLLTIENWLWRKELDTQAIQSIYALQKQINSKQTIKNSALNIKLDQGGIRTLETFVQALQLIHGGNNPDLRVSNITSALTELSIENLISEQTCETLTHCYLFLRNTEHRLQMQEDSRTHTLPEGEEELEIFVAFMGYPSVDSFMQDLNEVRNSVQEICLKSSSSKIIYLCGNMLFTGIEDDAETLENLYKIGFNHPKRITSSIRNWLQGKYPSTAGEANHHKITEVVPSLLYSMSRTSTPDYAFANFDEFLSRFSEDTNIFSIFANSTQKMNAIINIMGTSPIMASHILAHPRLLGDVLSQGYLEYFSELDVLKNELSDILMEEKNYDEAINSVIRFVNEKKFHAGTHILEGATSITQISKYLSDIAETAISCLLPYIQEEFEKTHGKFKSGEFALILMGSLGAQQFSTDSDLDMIPIYKVDEKEAQSDGKVPLSPSIYYIRLTQKIINALSTYNESGKLYEVDPRLRPEGEKGPIASRFENFIQYQKDNPWTWEYINLTRCRIISPNYDLERALQYEFNKIILAPKDKKILKENILKRQKEISERFSPKNKWDLKYTLGGMMDIVIITQYLILLNANPKINSNNTVKAIENLVNANILAKNTGEILIKSYKLLQTTNCLLKLTGCFPFNPEFVSDKTKKTIANIVLKKEYSDSFNFLEEKIDYAVKTCHAIYQETFEQD